MNERISFVRRTLSGTTLRHPGRAWCNRPVLVVMFYCGDPIAVRARNGRTALAAGAPRFEDGVPVSHRLDRSGQ